MRSTKARLITGMTWIIAVTYFFPVAWMFINSFKTENDAASLTPKFIFTPTLEGFSRLGERGMSNYLTNSLMASVVSTALVLALSIPAAYALSIRPIHKVQDALFFFISTRFMPAAASILPLFIIFKNLHVLDNIFALSLVYAAMNLPIAIWMMRSFLSEVPHEVIEASRIDGADFETELWSVVLPIVLPGIAAVALICFIFSWNEYFFSVLLTSANAKTTPPFLASFVDGRGQFLAVLSAASTVAALPVILAGWFAQKQLVRGLAMGAVK
ncbi:carbohydrate ABC transporter permease [Actinobacteria bacterium IMCC25003]|nr:carbohydrate ABC transporter permease [Actinobacteria bacterium IMCC25003]